MSPYSSTGDIFSDHCLIACMRPDGILIDAERLGVSRDEARELLRRIHERLQEQAE